MIWQRILARPLIAAAEQSVAASTRQIRARLTALLATFVTLMAMPAMATTHVALVVDTSPVAQAGGTSRPREIARSLEQKNYRVILAEGADSTRLRQVLAEFRDSASAAEVAVFYYHGRALTLGGRNHLVATSTGAGGIEAATVPLDEIASQMTAAQANIVMLETGHPDAQLAQLATQRSDISIALAELQPRPRFLVASALVPGQRPGPGSKGVFSDALVSQLANGDDNWLALAESVRWDTFQRSKGAEVPFVLSSLQSPVRLLPPGVGPLPRGTAPLPRRELSTADRTVFVRRLQQSLKSRTCHQPEIDGDVATVSRELEKMRQFRTDLPALDLETANESDWTAWLQWLEGAKGRLCPPAKPEIATTAPPVLPKAAPPRTPPKSAPESRPERPKARPVRVAPPPPRRRAPEVQRRAPRREPAPARNSGGGGTPRIPAF